MRLSTVILFAAGASAMPMPNGPLAALEGRASGAIGNILNYFRRDDDGVVWKQTRAPLNALEAPIRAEFVPVRRGDKKRAVPAVGRTVLLPRDVDNGGVN